MMQQNQKIDKQEELKKFFMFFMDGEGKLKPCKLLFHDFISSGVSFNDWVHKIAKTAAEQSTLVMNAEEQLGVESEEQCDNNDDEIMDFDYVIDALKQRIHGLSENVGVARCKEEADYYRTQRHALLLFYYDMYNDTFFGIEDERRLHS